MSKICELSGPIPKNGNFNAIKIACCDFTFIQQILMPMTIMIIPWCPDSEKFI